MLVLATEVYDLPMENGKAFHTGNHPVEMFVPLLHMKAAGFDFEIATPSGRSVALEEWAMPHKDEKVVAMRNSMTNKLQEPLAYAAVPESLKEYAGVFVPGGHGALLLHENEALGKILRTAVAEEVPVLTLCHGPGALLAASKDGEKSPFAGKELVAFPDKFDTKVAPKIGYVPGNMQWHHMKRLEAAGGVVVDKDEMAPDGRVHRDGNLITGDSPDSSNAFGRLAADSLLEIVAN